jgi:hypothetical protein
VHQYVSRFFPFFPSNFLRGTWREKSVNNHFSSRYTTYFHCSYILQSQDHAMDMWIAMHTLARYMLWFYSGSQ